MRGKATYYTVVLGDTRITPAYAGKSIKTSPITMPAEDHPRLCGEKLPLRLNLLHRPGSPPPMRGKGLTDYFPEIMLRITPAYAGKSRYRRHEADCNKDHPRLCGEK